MFKDIGAGVILAFIIFLAFQGMNVIPLFFIVGLLGTAFVLANNAGITSKKFVSVNNKKLKLEFNEIGGQETAKNELLEALSFIKNLDVIKTLGIRPLKGILLVGPPGTGKTLLAKAAAGFIDSVFLSASGSEFIEMYAGIGAQRVRQLFDNARQSAKKMNKTNAVIFIDEIDVLAGKRGQHNSHLEYDQTLNQLLVEMDGLSIDDEIRLLIMGATNRPEILDPAIMRPGRFDRVVKVDLPDKEGRKHILKIHTRNKPLDNDVDLDEIARETFSFSGAHLESITNEAAILAMREGANKISHKHFVEAIDKVIMGEKIDRRPSDEELKRVAVHETGHAIISEVVKPGSVSSVTITPRGNALGYMRQSPSDDMYLYTKEYLQDQISICLGGASAEEIILGNKSTGSSNDFERAVEFAKKIIFSGLSTLGVVDKDSLSPKLQHDTISAILTEQEERVKAIVLKNTCLISEIGDILVHHEKIYGEQFKELASRIKNE